MLLATYTVLLLDETSQSKVNASSLSQAV